VTSPQAFAELRERGWKVRAPQRTFATIDHIVPTRAQARPFADVMAESMTEASRSRRSRCGASRSTARSSRASTRRT
jgi:3-isopropylmalate/(R)-2-methylmalate dehydratase large subunit